MLIHLSEVLSTAGKRYSCEADLDGQAYIRGFQPDRERLAAEELLMHMPVKILCREECKGLCHRCGASLNQGACHCKEEEMGDPGMAAILDIFRQPGNESDIPVLKKEV